MIMKKITIFLMIFVSAGCSDFLEEDTHGQIVGSNAVSSVEGLEAALTGSYKGMLRTWARGVLTAALEGFVMGGDDVTTLAGGNKADFRQMDQFNVNANNGRTGQIWSGCYKTIQGANNVINNYEPLLIEDAARVKTIAGEAYFLRALSYYWLVRGWGEVPLLLEEEFSDDQLKMKKSSPAEIYAIIESDLKKAEEFVPNTKREPGRPNKGSVKALLADVYLTEGGWPIKDASKYALAAAKAKEVIDAKALYGFDLVEHLDTLWSGRASAAGTPEEVFSFQTSIVFGGSTNSLYGAPATPGDEGGWDDFMAEIGFFNRFPAGKRKDVTFYTLFTKPDGTQVSWQNSLSKHPYYLKFRLRPRKANDGWTSSQPIHMIRYAHTLLVYAEAQARAAGTPGTEAYQAINAIRQRAGLSDLSGLSGSDFVQAVIDERAWEFAGEWTRWFDLQRLELVEAANAPVNKATNDLLPSGDITKSDYWYPIPLGDANMNENL
jgi:starch-binding outer membrane protein, SusD/RagB family